MSDEATQIGYRLVLLPRGQVLTAFIYASKSDIFYCVLSGSLRFEALRPKRVHI